MRANSIYIIFLLLLVFKACIDPFEPEIITTQEVMVIDGMITNRPGLHQVRVSTSSPYTDSQFSPVGGCVVSVSDDQGNIEFYSESMETAGVYESWLDEPFLEVGKSYSLQVVAPSDRIYVSDYDTLLSCPPIDSVYYSLELSGGEDPDDVWQGLRFYNDVRGFEDGTRNYRWKATATWEYHSPHIPEYVRYQGQNIPYIVDSVSTCWTTENIETVYAATTQLLTENNLYQNKLHYVSDQTPRLAARYSLLVEQYSLTDEAYNYWAKLATQSANSASFYETQPSSAQGNIYNANNPGEKVLGYFYATQARDKRIFVDYKDLDFYVAAYTCDLKRLRNNNSFIWDRYYYLISGNDIGPGPPWYAGPDNCFNCTFRGGSKEKPDFW